MKPAIRNGLTALIVVLLGVNVAVAVVRHGRTGRTRVAVAPAPSTTTSPTTSPTTETTTNAPTTSVATTDAPTTGLVPTTPTTAVAPAPAGSADTGATVATVATTVPDTTTVPATGPTAGQVGPAPLAEHPHTGGHPLSQLALLLVGVGLMGLRFTRRTRSTPSR